MIRARLCGLLAALTWLSVVSAAKAQQPPPATRSPDAPGYLERLGDSIFDVKGLPGCAETLFTGKPLHIAVGSIAPQNGFGAGLALVGHKTTGNWRDSWSADAVASNNGSWRAGVYFKF